MDTTTTLPHSPDTASDACLYARLEARLAAQLAHDIQALGPRANQLSWLARYRAKAPIAPSTVGAP